MGSLDCKIIRETQPPPPPPSYEYMPTTEYRMTFSLKVLDCAKLTAQIFVSKIEEAGK